MMKFFVKKQYIFTFCILLMTMVMWAENTITGSGTDYDPYVLNSDDDWDVIAKDDSYWAESVYIKLGANIDVTIDDGSGFIGNSKKSYKGHFDGNWKTIRFYCGMDTDPHKQDYCAPFQYVDGAYISNLTVTGEIHTQGQYAGGIIGCVTNDVLSTDLTSCTSTVAIYTYVKGAAYHGGLVGKINKGTVNFKWCIFDGSIIGGDSSNCGGFVGYVVGMSEKENSVANYNYCTMAYNEITLDGGFSTFHILGQYAEGNFRNTYYLRRLQSDDQGIQAQTTSSATPTNGVAKLYNIGNTSYFVPSADIDIQTSYVYAGLFAPSVKYYGKELVKGTDYNLTVANDNKTITVTGINNVVNNKPVGYVGIKSYTLTTAIQDVSTWAKLNSILGSSYNDKYRVIVLNDDLSADGAAGLVIKKSGQATVTLNLNGHKLDRGLSSGTSNGYVVKIDENVNATINGPGEIKGGRNNGNGGGIYVSKGAILTLNNVTVKDNKCYDTKVNYNCGGGIYHYGSAFTMNGGSVINNECVSGGAGLCNEGSSFVMYGVTVEGNIADSKGAGIRVKKENTTIKGCTFINNELNKHDAADGGAIYNNGKSNLLVENCSIIGNKAWRWGGALYQQAGSTTLKNCVIVENSGTIEGGAVYIYDGTLLIDGCTISGNTSSSVGGVYIRPTGNKLSIKGENIILDNNGAPSRKNIYLTGSTSYINITGNLGQSIIGLSRQGSDTNNKITNGLNGKGSINNFKSDNYLLYWFSTKNNELYLEQSLYWRTHAWNDDNTLKKDNVAKRYIVKAPVIVTKGDPIVIESDYDIVIPNNTQGEIFIEDGGQIVYGGTPVKINALNKIYQTVITIDNQHPVQTESYLGWYLISSPVNQVNILDNTNLITSRSYPYNFDFMRYNEQEGNDKPWETFTNQDHPHARFSIDDPQSYMENGRGYMYRNGFFKIGSTASQDTTMIIEVTGNTIQTFFKKDKVIVEQPVTYTITNSGGNLGGWNIIGNPYPHDIYKNDVARTGDDLPAINNEGLDVGYYTPNSKGGWDKQLGFKNPIKSGRAALVHANEKEVIVSINNNANPADKYSAKRDGEIAFVEFAVHNSQYDDAACALFQKGRGLAKIDHINPYIPMIYIRQDDKDYAIATMGNNIKSFDLNFKAMTAGKYTLSYKSDGEFSYLHVIDRLTGRDIDMLVDEEYSFIGSPKDTESRFIVRLDYKSGDTDNEIFAYQNGNDIIVNGEGELQVFDLMGRLVMQKHINGVESINAEAQGVYIFKLNDKVQKIVVR